MKRIILCWLAAPLGLTVLPAWAQKCARWCANCPAAERSGAAGAKPESIAANRPAQGN